MRNIFKTFFVVAVSLFILQPASSYADWHGHNSSGHGDWHGHNNGWHGHGRSYVGVDLALWPGSYYYGAPYYYPPEDGVLVSEPVDEPVVVTQAEAPAPVITAPAPTEDASDYFTINIPNKRGGYTAITLKRSGNGYIGPQGEFYPEFPKVSQLEVIYGK